MNTYTSQVLWVKCLAVVWWVVEYEREGCTDPSTYAQRQGILIWRQCSQINLTHGLSFRIFLMPMEARP